MSDTELEIKLRIADISIEQSQLCDSLNKRSIDRLWKLEQESGELIKQLLERKNKHDK